MSADIGDWTSFWDLASPEEAARVLRTFYGTAAAKAAARCADAAKADDRQSDHRFWMATCAALTGTASDEATVASATSVDPITRA